MRKLKVFLPISILLIALIAAGLMVANKQAPQIKPETPSIPLVSTVEIQPQQVTLQVTSQGQIRSHSRSQLSAEVSGQVIAVSDKLVKGGFFEQGELLLQIDPADYQADVRQAEAALASAHAQLLQEKARADQALQDWKTLGNQNSASPLVVRQPQLAQAQASIKSAEAALDRAKRKLEKTMIRAPWPAMISQKMAQQGQFVTLGSPIAELLAVDYAEVRLPISDRELAWLQDIAPGNQQSGPEVLLTTRYRGQQIQRRARITRDEGTISETTRMHYLIARLDDPYNLAKNPLLKPMKIGSFIEASISGKQLENVLVIPRQYLQSDNQLHLLGPKNRLNIEQVKPLQSTGKQVIVQLDQPRTITLVTSALLNATQDQPLRLDETGQPASQQLSATPLEEAQ